jgi:hypothetical protein
MMIRQRILGVAYLRQTRVGQIEVGSEDCGHV